MDKLIVLTNMIILLLKSKDELTISLGKKLLESLKSKIKTFNTGDIIKDLAGVIETLIVNDVEDIDGFVDNLNLTLSNRQDILKMIKKYKDEDLNKNNNLKKYLIKTVNDYLKKEEMINLLQFNLFKVKTAASFAAIEQNLSDMIDTFQKLNSLKKEDDTGVVEEVDIDAEDSIALNNVVERIKQKRDDKYIYKTGWECLNTMIQGGFRLGEFTTFAGLQHNYKTGFTLTAFTQIVTLNKPIIRLDNKKPLAVLFSLEDENENVFEFIYRYLKITYDNEVIKDFATIDSKEVVEYIRNKLKQQGWSVKIIRMDPNDITWFDIKRKMEIYQLEGYDLQVVFVDYLSQIRKDGLAQGPAGSDLKDLFKKARNFANINKILFVTPHQLSTDANQLLRNQLPPLEFVKYIANRNYYDGSKRIAQEIDLELYVHIATKDKKPVLTMQRGKHRGHPNIDDDKKYALLEFIIKNNAPIPGDGEHHHPCIETSSDDLDLDI